MLALGRLLRLSLAPSALADVAAGTVLVAGRWPDGPAPWVAMLASACVYHGGMALNDWADRAADARDGRARPIPRGEIAAPRALTLAIVLLVAGPLLAALVAPRAALVLATVAALAAAYDLIGRGAWIGPLLLGACRAGNLAFGMALGVAVGGTISGPTLAVVAGGYGLYVFFLSRLARLEDRPESELASAHPERWLVLAAVALGLQGALARLSSDLASTLGARAAVILSAWGAVTLFRVRPAATWRPQDAGRVAGAGLRRLLVATAAIALQSAAPSAPLVAAAILAGYPVSYALRRVFPPT